MSVILIGFMGAGKSTVARILSPDYIDLDQTIENQIQMSIADFFRLFGQEDFRQIENEVLKASLDMDFVIATGGGIVENPLNLSLLQAQKAVVYLKADFETLWDRIQADKDNVRPLAQNGRAAAEALFEKRQALYEQVADIVVESAGKSPEEIALEIRNWQLESK